MTGAQIRFVLFVWLAITSFCSPLQAQPFDTLLLQFHQIDRIAPLSDGTFILVGEGEKILVERINSKAETIWRTAIAKNVFDDVLGSAIHILANDSSIQVHASRRTCDGQTYLHRFMKI